MNSERTVGKYQIMDGQRITEQWLSDLIATWPGSHAHHKPEWDTFVLTVAGKLFALYNSADIRQLLTLKGDPLENEALCQMHPLITPGYHMNKRHWVSIPSSEADCPLELDEIAELLETAYQLVFNALPNGNKNLCLKKHGCKSSQKGELCLYTRNTQRESSDVAR